MSEEWRIVPGLPQYAISDMGRLKLAADFGNRRSGLILRGTKIRSYQWFSLTETSGQRRMWSAHALVLTTFVGPRPSSLHHGAHNNGDRTDNRLSNLRWATWIENIQDGVRHGSWKGERHSKAKLTDDAVLEMRRLHKMGRATASLAVEFGVHKNTAAAAVTKRTWTHV